MTFRPGALFTDLYELTMLHAYWVHGMTETASFEFFVRALPSGREFLVAAGLEPAVEHLTGLRFAPEELEWIGSCGRFRPGFARALADLRFTGDVDAMPEGTVFFPGEPVLRVTAPLPEAQLVETRLINLLNFSTLVASQAARFVRAAPGKTLVDFGLRRAHGAEAGLLAARAAYLAGFAGTSAAAAAREFGIPVYGTMAHSFVQAFDDEAEAFAAFARADAAPAVFLLDTYDTEAAAGKVAALAPVLAREGLRVGGVRLDSGDLAAHARLVRGILDRAGLREAVIMASGDLDVPRVRALVEGGAPIDAFGVGGALTTSADAPLLDCAYKLVEYAGAPRRKRSEGKATLPGRKQVYRRAAADGTFAEDEVTVEGDRLPGEPLLVPVLRGGRPTGPRPTLERSRARAREQLGRVPPCGGGPYRVTASAALRALTRAADERAAGRSAPAR